MVSIVQKVVSVLKSPSHWALISRDALGILHAAETDEKHLLEAIAWLCRAHDADGRRGVSAGYSAGDGGWLPPYPETTGYIIRTLLDYAASHDRHDLVDRATRMGDWEIEIQMPTGAVRGGIGVNGYPIVFNTGQVINGWVALYRATGEQRFLDAANRAANWLRQVQDGDGKWQRFTPNGKALAYYTYVTWPLLDLHSITHDAQVWDSALANVDWACRQANGVGWFDVGGYSRLPSSLTHFLGYTVHGLIECAMYLQEPLRSRVLGLAELGGAHALSTYERRVSAAGRTPFPAVLDERWESKEASACVTGNAQFAHIWLRLFQLTGNQRYLDGGSKMLRFVERTQSLVSSNPGIRGAIPGSYPTWGPYFTLAFPNWATKFFADALMLRLGIDANLREPVALPRPQQPSAGSPWAQS